MSKALFTILYPFMSSTLGLSGYEKETFAAIFGFWMNAGEIPVRASFTTIQKMTGGSRPAISRAVNSLIDGHFISPDKHPGKPTMYSVTISPEIISEFKLTYKQKPIGSDNQRELNQRTTTGSGAEPQKRTKIKSKNNSTLRVKKNEEITTGGLPEAK